MDALPELPSIDDGATFEQYGIRCLGGYSTSMAESVPLNRREHNILLLLKDLQECEGRDLEELDLKFELFIIRQFLGVSQHHQQQDGQIEERVIAAWQRPFIEWLELIHYNHPNVSLEICRRQLGVAWRTVELLLIHNPVDTSR